MFFTRPHHLVAFLGVYLSPIPFLVVPTCPVPLLGRDLLSRLVASISFVHHICLNSSSPAVPLLLLLASQPTNNTMSFPLPTAQVDPRVWDIQNPSVTKHHSPVVIQLLDPTRCITQVQYTLSVQILSDLSQSFLTS